jgi:hypothetical protein
MSLPVLTSMPERITAGATLKYSRSFSDFRADDGWTLELRLAGRNLLTVAGTPNGASFDFALAVAATATLGAGNYTWRELATKAGETFVAASGAVTVEADIAAAQAGDFLSWAERTLPVVEAAIAWRLTGDVQSYSIAGRSMTKIPMAELLQLRATCQAAVQRGQHPGKFGPQVLAAFTGTQSERDSVSVPPPVGPF